jgi:hypothetical protein
MISSWTRKGRLLPKGQSKARLFSQQHKGANTVKKSQRRNHDRDEVLTRVVQSIEKKDFFRSILINDTFDDWNLARDFGGFLTRIEPEEFMGHALLARSLRHLGNLEGALAELQKCRAHPPHESEKELFRSFLKEEERLLAPILPRKSEAS